MKALFAPSPRGCQVDARGLLGDLKQVAEQATGPLVLTGDSLEAIAAGAGIALSPAGRRARGVARRSEPAPLTARQLRLWLIQAGLTPAAVDAQIAAMPDDTARAKAQVEWDYAAAYHRDHPLVIQIGASLGLTPTQIDAAFCAAAAL